MIIDTMSRYIRYFFNTYRKKKDNVMKCRMKFLGKIEKEAKMSGYQIMHYLGVHSSQYYTWKKEGKQSMQFKHLCKLAALPNIGWEKIGKWIDAEFKKES